MKTGTVLAVCGILACSAVAGCATKRYPIATQFTAAEANAMSCRDLNLELIRAEQVQLQIAETAEVDWRSAAGFLGDYGIGNAMAKSEADRAIAERISGIRAAQATKDCQNNPGGMAAAAGQFLGMVLGRNVSVR